MARNLPNTVVQRMSVRQTAILMMVLFAFSALLFLLDFERPGAVRYEPQPSDQFVPLAMLSNVTLLQPPALGNGTAVLVGALTPNADRVVTAVDSATGQIRWTLDGARQSRPDWWPPEWGWKLPITWNWGPVAVIDDQVFVADAFGLTTSVTAFDVAAGTMNWQRQIGTLNGSDVSYLAAADDQLAVRVSVEGYSDFLLYRPVDGWRTWRQTKNVSHIFFVEEEPFRQYEAFPFGAQTTGRDAWKRPFAGCAAAPLLLPEQIIIRTQRSCEPDSAPLADLLALDRQTGVVLWQLTVPVVSNVVIDGRTVYAVTEQNQLVAVDAQTGQIAGTLAFTPNVAPASVFIGAGDGQTAVYFGDSQQLFTIQINY